MRVALTGARAAHEVDQRDQPVLQDAAGQQAAVWLETRFPSPKTTGLPLILRIGWTTCTC